MNYRTIRKVLVTIIFLFALHKSYAQNKFTVSGYVRDSASGESLINANVLAQQGKGVQTNAYGFYSITLPEDNYTLNVSFSGYAPASFNLQLSHDTVINLKLSKMENALQEVVVRAERRMTRVNTIITGAQQLDVNTIKRIPAFMGEADVIKSLAALPGITSVGEGASGFNVRGGNVDENLINLDEAPVYNSSHLLGFFSVFNPDAVKNVTLYKGVFPAEYGGRISSVLDVRMKEGNNQEYKANGGVGTIFSRFSFEGPIQKGKSSFIVAARRSYIDVLSKPFLKKEDRDNIIYFYDLTAKANFQLNKNNTIFVSGYFGRDVFGFQNVAAFNWGNYTTTVRWNHLFSPKLFLNTSAFYSNYDYRLRFNDEETGEEVYHWKSFIKTTGLKSTLTFFSNTSHQFNGGVQLVNYNFYPGKGELTDDGTKNTILLKQKYGAEGSAFIEHKWKINKLQLQYGLRATQYAFLGKSTAFYYRDTTAGIRKELDYTKDFKKGEVISRYNYLEPRASLRYEIKKNLLLKAGYSKNTQFVHLISNTASPTPVDLYVPSTNNVKPSLATQGALGMIWQPRFLGGLEFSVEGFYKKMSDLVDYIDNANLELNEYMEADLLPSKGKAYGVETELRKDAGKWQGWINYTYSKSYKRTEGINHGDWYLNRFDRTHIFNVVALYNHSEKWKWSATWNYSSGTPATFPDIRLDIQDMPVPYNSTGTRSNFRLPAYHRLDLSVTMKGKQSKKFQQEWVFGLYNVYARKNAYSIYFRPNEEDNNKYEAVRLSIIGSIIPSVTWNFSF